ncbi:MAG: glycosyltransferase family 39 protein, partial [Treponema sp.]|nr:glycosyltransferase family 39 protein [Treponema sp.]
MKTSFVNKFNELISKIEASRNGYDKYIAILILISFSILCFLYMKLTGIHNVRSDGLGYWRYLPDLFIRKDLSFKNKYTIGVALMELPFFLVAHFFSIISNLYKVDGYSFPYILSSLLAQMFYSNLGLMFVYKSLRKFYNVKITAITLATIAFSTGLFFYVGENYSHVFSFCVIAMFLYYMFKAYETDRIKDHIIVGLLLGVVACCRVTNIIVVLIYIFCGVKSPSDFIAKVKLKNTYLQFTASFISFLFVFSLQMIYWQHAFRSFIVNSYENEGFTFLLNPQLYNILFSLLRGLFVWHPIYLFVFIGFYFLIKNKNYRSYLIGTTVFFIIYLWITSSWWCWWYDWSFGQRPFNDILAVFAMPLAALIKKSDSIRFHYLKKTIINHSVHKKYFVVARLQFAVLIVFIFLFSIRNITFSLMLRDGLFTMKNINDLPYKFSDFVFISRPKNLFKDKIIWSDVNQFITASLHRPTTFAAFHGVEFATGPQGDKVHDFRIAGDGKAYYKNKEILNTDDLNYADYEIKTNKKWI